MTHASWDITIHEYRLIAHQPEELKSAPAAIPKNISLQGVLNLVASERAKAEAAATKDPLSPHSFEIQRALQSVKAAEKHVNEEAKKHRQPVDLKSLSEYAGADLRVAKDILEKAISILQSVLHAPVSPPESVSKESLRLKDVGNSETLWEIKRQLKARATTGIRGNYEYRGPGNTGRSIEEIALLNREAELKNYQEMLRAAGFQVAVQDPSRNPTIEAAQQKKNEADAANPRQNPAVYQASLDLSAAKESSFIAAAAATGVSMEQQLCNRQEQLLVAAKKEAETLTPEQGAALVAKHIVDPSTAEHTTIEQQLRKTFEPVKIEPLDLSKAETYEARLLALSGYEIDLKEIEEQRRKDDRPSARTIDGEIMAPSPTVTAFGASGDFRNGWVRGIMRDIKNETNAKVFAFLAAAVDEARNKVLVATTDPVERVHFLRGDTVPIAIFKTAFEKARRSILESDDPVTVLKALIQSGGVQNNFYATGALLREVLKVSNTIEDIPFEGIKFSFVDGVLRMETPRNKIRLEDGREFKGPHTIPANVDLWMNTMGFGFGKTFFKKTNLGVTFGDGNRKGTFVDR